MAQSAGKRMAFVFWNTHRIIFIKYLEKVKIINREYTRASLVRLKKEIEEKQF